MSEQQERWTIWLGKSGKPLVQPRTVGARRVEVVPADRERALEAELKNRTRTATDTMARHRERAEKAEAENRALVEALRSIRLDVVRQRESNDHLSPWHAIRIKIDAALSSTEGAGDE